MFSRRWNQTENHTSLPWKYEAHELRAFQQIVPSVHSFQPGSIRWPSLTLLVQGPIGIPYPSRVPAGHKNMEFASTFLISSSLLTMTILHIHQTLSNHLESYFRSRLRVQWKIEQIKNLTLFWSGESFSKIISVSQEVIIRDKSIKRITNEIDINWFWFWKW